MRARAALVHTAGDRDAVIVRRFFQPLLDAVMMEADLDVRGPDPVALQVDVNRDRILERGVRERDLHQMLLTSLESEDVLHGVCNDE